MQLNWYNLPKIGYFQIFTKIWTPKIFFQRWLYTTGSYAEIFFGIFSAHLRYLPILPFLRQSQLAIFKIEYNAFSKAKWENPLSKGLPILGL